MFTACHIYGQTNHALLLKGEYMSSTQKIELTILGDMEKSGSFEITEGQTIAEALIANHIDVEKISFRLNGESAQGNEVVQDRDEVTAVPKVKAG